MLPGQRQFASFDAYAVYYMGKMKMSEEQFRDYCGIAHANSRSRTPRQTASRVSEACRARGIVLASHDDATVEHVAEAVEQGIRVAEFPTTAEAARGLQGGRARRPDGRAQRHARRARIRATCRRASSPRDGLLDILSSDYIPFSLIQAAFFIGEAVDGISLPQAVAMVSKNPAEAVSLDDRGVIEPGRRADLVRVRVDDHVPVVRTVWREGRRVA